MPLYFKTRITAVGPEVAELAEGGVLILFADGSPPELAEVSVLHRPEADPAETAPTPGAMIHIGTLSAEVTAVGETAWNKVREIGHVVINFNGAGAADRPGEICASAVDTAELAGALKMGAVIAIGE